MEHAQGWLSLAGATEIELLGWDSPDWVAAAAKMVEDRLVSTARWCSDVWQQSWSGVAAGQMAAAVSVAAQGDTDPEDWLWSPFGEPILGNSARLEGSQRHLAHMALLEGRYGKPAHTHEELLRTAEEHAKSLAEQARTEARTVLQRRERLLLRAPTLLHTAEHERTDEAMRAAEDTVRALHAATLDLLIFSSEASPLDAPSAIDATVAVTVNTWLVEGWKFWVYDRIATFLGGLHPEERPVNSLLLWMVADLMARNAFYSTAADSDEQAAAETLRLRVFGGWGGLRVPV